MSAPRAPVHPSDDTLRRMALDPLAGPLWRCHVDACARCRREVALVVALAKARRLPAGPCPDALKLVLLAEERLDHASAPALRAHVGSCPACASDVEGLMAPARQPGPKRSAARSATRTVAAASTSMVEKLKELSAWQMPVLVPIQVRSSTAPLVSPALRKGLEAYGRGRHAEARKLLEEAVLEPKPRAEAHYFLAACLVSAGRHDEAVAHLERAGRLQPRVPEYRWMLAQVLLLAGRGEEARVNLRALARKAGSRRAAAKEQLARLRKSLGDSET
jgi:tetratricopeptide (TPR) repeat protein